MRSLRRKHRFEASDYVSDNVAEVIDDRPDVVTVKGFALPERYVRHELQIWIGVWLRSVIHQDADYLVVLERAPCPNRSRRWWRRIVGERGGVHVTCQRHGNDGAVFVDVVEVAQLVETIWQVPSVVRLYRVKSFSDFFGYAAADVWQDPAKALARLSIKDRERRTSCRLVTAQPNELKGDVIEHYPEVMNCVSSDGPPLRVWGWGIDNPMDVPTTLVVDFHNGLARAMWESPPECVVEFVCMDFYPVHFDLDAVKGGGLPPPLPLRHYPLLPLEANAQKREDREDAEGRDRSGAAPC